MYQTKPNRKSDNQQSTQSWRQLIANPTVVFSPTESPNGNLSLALDRIYAISAAIPTAGLHITGNLLIMSSVQLTKVVKTWINYIVS